jgi:2-amino-4-hydroxy-6-hydroxymethyldihydropteridine diphosphokinase
LPGPSPKLAYLGLGGNLGDPAASMAAALQALDRSPDVRVAAVSSLYRTPPWGVTDQPDFLNAVAAVETSLTARDLLDLCLASERALKRVRNERWGPRSIDIDILMFADETITAEGLQVPHPRMTERAFVLAPLAEIAPDLVIADRPILDHLGSVDTAGIVKIPGGRNWWTKSAT